MALYAFDGTWNSEKSTEAGDCRNTNVYRFHAAYAARSRTHDYYAAGVGTRFDVVGKVLGGAFGLGELARLNEAYAHLCRNWVGHDSAPADATIDVVGFSRGAATALDFCHIVMERGIRHPDTEAVLDPAPVIRFLGLWDCVAAFGLAFLGNTALNLGHHLSLPADRLRYCFHALALDERRPSFLPTRLNGAYEVWFRGVHSDVGGGDENPGLNDITLRWMMRKAMAAGLPLTEADVATLHPAPHTPPKPAAPLPFDIRAIAAVDRRHYTADPQPPWRTAPDTCPIETEQEEGTARPVGPAGVTALPMAVRRRVVAMWEAAEAVATAEAVSLAQVKGALLELFQERVILIANDDQLQQGRQAAAQLVSTMIQDARRGGYATTVPPFFFTQALYQSRHLTPLTD